MINLENFDSDKALRRLFRFLSVEGISGQEKAIADEVIKSLIEIGVPENCIYFDDANIRIPVSTQTGNLIVNLPGTISGDRKLFSAHLDTVPLCAGSVPVLNGTRISPAGNTALGGDNRTGVACLVSVISTLFDNKHAEVRFVSNLAYNPFHLDENSSCVQQCLAAARGIGQDKVYCKISNGGLDANWLVQHGIPTVTLNESQI